MSGYDVVVVGAGTGGCITAKTLALAGFDICLVERKEKKSIGDKVCGDAIGKHHFENLGLASPRGEEKEGDISGIKIFPPDLKAIFRLGSAGLTGFMINRYLFGQRLLKESLDAGAVLLDSTHVSEPIIENGFVKGVSTKNLETGSKNKLRGRVIVDASGFTATVRKNLPPEIGIDPEISKEDQAICYREIRKLKEGIEERDYLEIYLDLKVAPGGYYWIFPEAGTKVNVGLGVAAVENHPNPKSQLYRHVLSSSLFKSSSVLHRGGGIVPTRRPLNSLVGNGVVVIGDSACQVNPIHGGGIGPSMMGGKIAGEVITEVLEESEPTRERLWPINVRFMKGYGSKQAGLDVFRIFLQGLTNADLNYGMRYRLIKEDDILKVSLGGEVHLNITDKTRRIFRGLGRLSFLKRLYNMAKTVKKIKMLYREYPDSPEGMLEWKTKIQELY